MSEPFEAFADALQSAAERGAPAEPRTDDILEAYADERSPFAALSRDLLGLGPGRLPARGTARRTEYERTRREVRAMARGVRPSRHLARRILRSPRIARAVQARRLRGVAGRLRTRGGGIGVDGDVRTFGYLETRKMPARGLQPMEPAAWGRILDAFTAGDRQGFADVLSAEFGRAYMGGAGALTGAQREAEAPVELLDIELTIEPGGEE